MSSRWLWYKCFCFYTKVVSRMAIQLWSFLWEANAINMAEKYKIYNKYDCIRCVCLTLASEGKRRINTGSKCIYVPRFPLALRVKNLQIYTRFPWFPKTIIVRWKITNYIGNLEPIFLCLDASILLGFIHRKPGI